MTDTTTLAHSTLDRLGRQVGTERPAGRDDHARIAGLAREFEAFVVLQMVRQMRESALAGQDEDGFGAATMNDTIDVEFARHLAASGGFGLAEVLARAIERHVGAGPDEPVDAPEAGAAGPAGYADPKGDATHRAPGLPIRAQTAVGGPAVPLPVSAPTSSPFGWRVDPLGQGTRFHSGVDLAAAYGQAVPSVAAGRVVAAGEQRGYGLTVVVEHAGGVTSRYGHLSSLDVRTGDTVAEGTVVGRVGSTGRSTGPHLHFEVQVDGRPVDPVRAASRYASLLKVAEADADSPNEEPNRVRVVAGVSNED